MKFSVGQEVVIVKYAPFETDLEEKRELYKSFVGKRARVLRIYLPASDRPSTAPYHLDTYSPSTPEGISWREEELEDPFVAACREALDDTTTV